MLGCPVLLFSPILCIFGFGIGALSKRILFLVAYSLVVCIYFNLFSILAGPKGFCSLASLYFAFILFLLHIFIFLSLFLF